MPNFRNALIAGAAGSLTTNVLHEIVRRLRRDAPRVDKLGMEALSKTLAAVDVAPPAGRDLYAATLAADLVTNAGYFALTRFAPGERYISAGAALGLTAGIGAVVLPAPMGLNDDFTNHTPATQMLSVALYLAGGVVSGLTFRALAA